MKSRGCGREADVARAARVGVWAVELRTHATQCAVCREVALVTCALVAERQRQLAGRPVADAGVVWWRAQLRVRYQRTEWATRPIAVVEGLAHVVTIAAATLALARPWHQLPMWAPALPVEALSGMSSLGVLVAAGAGGVVLAVLLRGSFGLGRSE